MKKVTIKDIAKIAGVNNSTVSRALAGHPHISEEKKQAIRKIAEELKYFPNDLAKGLRIKVTHSIGLIIPDIQNPFYPAVTRGIEDRLNSEDYNVLLGNSDYDPKKEKKYLNLLLSKQVDGFIIFPSTIKTEVYDILKQRHIPFVFVDYTPKNYNANYVYTDHEIGSYIAVKHLIENNHTQIILYVEQGKEISSVQQMEIGYRRAMNEEGIKIQPWFIFSGSLQERNALEEKTFNLLKNRANFPYTAILCASDVIARSIYEVAPRLNLRIPGDISIIGYDNTFICTSLTPQLTSVNQPGYELGSQAAELLLKHLKKDTECEYQTIRFSPRLIKRQSVAKLKPA
jgi:DNA-binding LacI/PurR family transcriptional regulator